LTPRARADHERKLEPARLVLGSAAAEAAWTAAQGMSLAEAVAYALEREPDTSGPLTPREEEVAALVVQGLSNRQIAERLVISARTADNHLQHILNKLGLGSRAELAAWVVERNQARASNVAVPLYMDIHRELGDLTAALVADAHHKDLALQSKYGVRYLKYWFDSASGKVFCLVEAPSAEAAIAVHRDAHGLLPDEIFEVEEGG
jgi:DNA-binding CsgD family transcriptional regulator